MESEKCKIENKKIVVDILKFKTMIFTGVLGSGIYLILNANKLVEFVNLFLIKLVVVLLINYGSFGFLKNVIELNKILQKLKV
jgi:hypothetical protein